MFPNKLEAIWAEGRPVLNGWLSIGNPFTAEIMAAQGYDSVTVDAQHGALDYGDLLSMLQAMRAWGVVPTARVPWLEPGIVMKVLDAGALGVICPMINTAEEAARLVDCVRYPPEGSRSFGPTRAAYAAGANYAVEANGNILAFAMVETREAVENLDAIARTPGLDGIYVGPADLTLSLHEGRLAPPSTARSPRWSRCSSGSPRRPSGRGSTAAPRTTPRAAAGWGFDLTTVGGDSRLLAAAAQASVARFRELTDRPAEAPAGAGPT